MESQRIRVVFGVNDFLIGGMQRQFVEQLKQFDRDRFEIILITLFTFPGERTFYAELPNDLEVHRLSFTGVSDLRSWYRLYNLLRSLKPDIVVSSLFFSNTVFRVLKPLVGYASIAREHNTYSDKKDWQRFIDRVLAPLSVTIVAVSTSVADFTSVDERIPRARFTVIHNGIDVNAARARLATLPSRERLKEDIGLLPADRLLLTVSRLMPQKNHRLLMEGFTAFHKIHPEYRLAIVGEGPLLGDLEQMAKTAGTGESVMFFGHRDEVWNFYKAADAYVSTSDIEGLSNSMLEALAGGVPLIATRTAGTDELLEDGINGFFIEETSAQGVSDALLRFASADAVVLGSAARNTAEQFSISQTVERYQSLFTESVQI